LANSDIIHFCSGMADGSDVWLSQIVLDLRDAGFPIQNYIVPRERSNRTGGVKLLENGIIPFLTIQVRLST